MTPVEAAILGIVQGLTEFLPISSSGHLEIVGQMMGDRPGAAFIAVIQLGTMAAVLLYFRKDLLGITRGFLRGLRDKGARTTTEWRLAWYIAAGTIPIGLLGVAFEQRIEAGQTLRLIATMLIALGLLLLVAERVGRRTRGLDSLTLKDSLVIGAAQAAALIPGVSRSGSTITAGLFLGLDRPTAARFSFLLSIPAVVLSGVFQLGDIGGPGSAGPTQTVIATVLAFVSGYAAIAGLLKFLATHSTLVFVAYRVVVGVLVLVLVGTDGLNNCPE
ncbi:MAG: undecaprenyl-diphosphate phosphatase, partial [Actinomycetota bacterium]